MLKMKNYGRNIFQFPIIYLYLHHKSNKKINKYVIDMEKVNKEPIVPVLRKMAVGETHTYPCSRMNVVRSTINMMKITTDMEFTSKLDKPHIHITRVK